MTGLTLAECITLCTCRKSDNNPDRCKARIAAVERMIAVRELAEDDMCPNCLTPWKCNGPHEPASYDADAAEDTFLRDLLERQRVTWDERHGDQP